MVVGQQFLQVEPVIKALFDAPYPHFHVGRSVEGRNALAETTVCAAVFERHHQGVVGLQGVERIGVHRMEVARVDEGGVNALLGEQTHDVLALLEEGTGCDDRHLLSAVHHLVLRDVGILLIDRLGRVVHAVARYAEGDGALVLVHRPAQHGEIFFAGGGSEINESGYAA